MTSAKYLLYLPLLVLSTQGFSQVVSPEIKKISIGKDKVQIVAALPKILKEASGLYIDRNKNFWSHNDDRYSFLYCFDSTGKIIKTVYINHKNKGWEDLAYDEDNNVYIGSFGNNTNDRTDLTIYKIGSPDTINSQVTLGETINYRYGDQKIFPAPPSQRNYDADALIAFKGSLYIFTKNRTNPFTGYTRVYQLPQTPGNYQAQLMDSIFVGTGPMMEYWVTGADLSPDQNTLALQGHEKIWLISDFEGDKFSTGKVTEITLPDFTHKAGISFSGNETLYIVDELEFEILGGHLYKIDISGLKK
ncbi:MAG: hypothetical protein JNM78_14080 [Cyclobacteriaceae bacterium]|nr:hypothetical protein [Cyclobacteriaceae bacterium]